MLIEAKSNLARLMATENLVVEERNVETASFDIKSRILTVPILNGNLSPYLYDLLLGHEVGHALETPAQGWHDSIFDHKVNKSILNVCEDVRIEKKIKRKFPGLKLSFVRGYNELMDMDFFGVKGTDLNDLNFIDRVNLHTKGGASQGIEFNEKETELLSEIESTETWPEVVAVARKVQDFMKAQLEELKKMNNKDVVPGKTKQSSSGTEAQPLDEGVEEEKEQKQDKPGTGEPTEAHTPGDDDQDGQDTENQSSGGNDGGEDYDLKSETDEAFRERERDLYDTKNVKKDIIYSTIPKTDSGATIFTYKEVLEKIELHNKKMVSYGQSRLNVKKLDENFVKFKNESTKIVSYLVKEFELRKNADQQKRASVSKTGELNMNRISEYKLTDDIFKRMTNVPNGKSHGLVMFVDWSGSMNDHLPATIRQLLNLVMFCKRVNIPFDVYAFTTQWWKYDKNSHLPSKKQESKVGDLVVDQNYSLMNLLSSRMTTKEYQNMSRYLLDIGSSWRLFSENFDMPDELSLGGTPLNSAIISAFDIIPKFKADNKLQIVNAVFLTDGESSSLPGRYAYIDARRDYHQTNSENVPNRNRRSFYRDEATKATEEVIVTRSSYGGTAMAETVTLLKLLKQRCECNIIGFFIGSTRNMSGMFANFAKDDLEAERWKTTFKSKGYLVVENGGYDEYYLIRAQSMELDDAELEVKTDTTRGFVSAFHKYVGNKVSSRIILNRFIGLIA